MYPLVQQQTIFWFVISVEGRCINEEDSMHVLLLLLKRDQTWPLRIGIDDIVWSTLLQILARLSDKPPP